MNAPAPAMEVGVHFYSYFKDLTGCASVREQLPAESRLEQLLQQLYLRFPRLEPMRHSTLIAVGLEYQDRNYVLRPGDEVSLFPPVQGG